MLPSLSYPGTSLLYFSGPQFLCLQTGLTHSCSAHILVKMRGVLSVLQGPDRQRQRCASICKEPASLGSCSLLRQPREVSSSFFCRRRNGGLETCLRLPSPLQAELTQHQAAAPPGFPELQVPEPCLPSGCGHSLRWGEAVAAPTAPHPQAGFWREGLDWQHAQVWQLLGTPEALVGKSLQCWGSGPRHDKAERVLCNQSRMYLGAAAPLLWCSGREINFNLGVNSSLGGKCQRSERAGGRRVPRLTWPLQPGCGGNAATMQHSPLGTLPR